MFPLLNALVDEGKRHDKAISVCLFSSRHYTRLKHLTTFIQFLKGPREVDVLIFIEEGFEDASMLPDGEGIRKFEVSGLVGWYRHLYRYLAADPNFDYSWIKFTGSDSPWQKWLNDLLPICESQDFPLAFMMRCTQPMDSLVSGSCWVRSDIQPSLHCEVLNCCETAPMLDQFQLDESFLTDWFLRARLPAVAYLQGSLINVRMQKWLVDRLYYGPELALVSKPVRPSGFVDGRLIL